MPAYQDRDPEYTVGGLKLLSGAKQHYALPEQKLVIGCRSTWFCYLVDSQVSLFVEIFRILAKHFFVDLIEGETLGAE